MYWEWEWMYSDTPKRIQLDQWLVGAAVVLLVVGAIGCGSSQRAGSSSRSSSISAKGADAAVPPSNSLTGDYDSDDDKNGHSDGDNDDSTLPKDGDNDSDNSTKSYFDSDDGSVLDFGHAANATDKKAITGLIKRYFAAASTENGTAACAMIMPTFANSVAETLGGAAGPPYARGSDCATVVSGIFEHYHRQIAAQAAELTVAFVRVKGSQGVVALAFKKLPGRDMHVARAGSVWKADALLDIELP